jgi:hypothetical protein
LAGSAVSYGYDSVFEDARVEPFTDQANDALVADAVLQEADQPVLADAAEEGDAKAAAELRRLVDFLTVPTTDIGALSYGSLFRQRTARHLIPSSSSC